MRKFLILLILLVAVLPALPVHASAPLVVDDADILSYDEEKALEEKAETLSDTYDMDIVIVTVYELDGQRSDRYARKYYEENLYGVGSGYDGILFLLSMEERDWAMVTCGDAKYVLTDNDIESVFSEISRYLSKDDYYTAFDCWLDELVHYFEDYEDGNTVPSRNYVQTVFISLAIGCVVALIVLLIMRSKMNTTKAQRGASSYLAENSYQLRLHRDIFLYSNISKIRRSENNSSNHRGGHSFGGGRGKF